MSSLSRINIGIWNAAIFGSGFLRNQYHINTHLWVCADRSEHNFKNVGVNFLGHGNLPPDRLKTIAGDNRLSADETVFVSHGAWLKPTRYGHALKESGYRWIYVPHGMLETWSLQQRHLKKQIYYHLFEKRWLKHADAIRAVSETERKNLEETLKKRVSLVENGVTVEPLNPKNADPETYLFMGRLHYKKGVFPLVKAWSEVFGGIEQKKLIIAGPDEGELEKIQPYIKGNIEYVGPVYGETKSALLQRANYFVLPSYSEGFPTTVLEAMNFGAVPLISKGCNFSQVFQHGLGYNIEPDEESIGHVFRGLMDQPFSTALSKRNHNFISSHYSEERIGEKLYRFYTSVLNEETVSHG